MLSVACNNQTTRFSIFYSGWLLKLQVEIKQRQNIHFMHLVCIISLLLSVCFLDISSQIPSHQIQINLNAFFPFKTGLFATWLTWKQTEANDQGRCEDHVNVSCYGSSGSDITKSTIGARYQGHNRCVYVQAELASIFRHLTATCLQEPIALHFVRLNAGRLSGATWMVIQKDARNTKKRSL